MSEAFDDWPTMLTLGTALGCALVAGVFFAFSTFVMPALSRLPAAQGIAAMKSINVAAITPSFMVVLFGTAAACLVLFASSLVMWSRPGAACVLAASLLYLVGTILVTIAFNVPRNEALAATEPTSAAAGGVWADYLVTWTAWNHVRTATALGATALLVVAFRLSRAAAP